MPEDKKTPVQKAMEKDCIVLVLGELVARIMQPVAYMEGADRPSVKCIGPACGQYAEFINKCGFAK